MILSGFHPRDAILVGTAVIGLTFAAPAAGATKPNPMNGLRAHPNPMNGLRLHGAHVRPLPHNFGPTHDAT